MSRLIVKNLPNGVSNPPGCQHSVMVAFCFGSPETVYLVCRWRTRGSSRCLLPSALWQTALWSLPRTASSASSALWVLKPRKTRTELWNISTRALWTPQEWRYGSSHGFTTEHACCWHYCCLSICEPTVVNYSRWRCVRPLETPLKQKLGANIPRAQARTNPPLPQTLTAKRYLQTQNNWQENGGELESLCIVSREKQ